MAKSLPTCSDSGNRPVQFFRKLPVMHYIYKTHTFIYRTMVVVGDSG
jgi:hypothetical protein